MKRLVLLLALAIPFLVRRNEDRCDWLPKAVLEQLRRGKPGRRDRRWNAALEIERQLAVVKENIARFAKGEPLQVCRK